MPLCENLLPVVYTPESRRSTIPPLPEIRMPTFLRSALLAVLATAVLTSPALADDKKQQPASKDAAKVEAQPTRYTTRKIHDPNGIGKFYMGREIAHVMGFLGAEWLEREEREREERLTLMVKSLKLKPGMVVADIGAGSGVISMLMSRQLGDEGKVLAVDIQDEMLDRLKKRLKIAGITNVKPVKGTIKSPNLKPGTVDLIIMVDVYHEFSYPYEMTLELAKSLKPGGRIAWVEYRKEDRSVPIKLVHKMTEAQVKKEAGQKEFGLKFVETIGVLPWQHIVIFEKPKKAEKKAAR
jgi:protein-L-isoaspartate O-methyltransferase